MVDLFLGRLACADERSDHPHACNSTDFAIGRKARLGKGNAPILTMLSSSPSSLFHLTPPSFFFNLSSILGCNTRCDEADTSIAWASGSRSKTTSEPVGRWTESES